MQTITRYPYMRSASLDSISWPTSVEFEFCYELTYRRSIAKTRATFINTYLDGDIALAGALIFFNGGHNEMTLLLEFDGIDNYGCPYLKKYIKHPDTGYFYRNPPPFGVWPTGHRQ